MPRHAKPKPAPPPPDPATLARADRLAATFEEAAPVFATLGVLPASPEVGRLYAAIRTLSAAAKPWLDAQAGLRPRKPGPSRSRAAPDLFPI